MNIFINIQNKDIKIMTEPHSRNKASQDYSWWHTQPVPKISEKILVNRNEWIEAPKDLKDIRQRPYDIPEQLEWFQFNIDDNQHSEMLYTFLNQNYVEDDDNMFRFDYSITFLQWALKPPGWRSDWHVGIRSCTKKKLLAFISAVPVRMRVFDKEINMVEINFLCVHKKLRSKGLAPVLISEITRRSNLANIWQAIYTAGVLLPKPVSSVHYFHRSLNPQKLIECGFSQLGPRMTMKRTLKLNQLPTQTQIIGLRRLKDEDITVCHKLLEDYLKKLDLTCAFTVDEFNHWFMNRPGIIEAWVVEDPMDHQIKAFLSFYILPSSIINHPLHKTLNAAYCFYIVPSATVPLKSLMNDALIIAKQLNLDVFNCLNIFDNNTVFKDLKFVQGDGVLHYYFYNWRCASLSTNRVGMVLL